MGRTERIEAANGYPNFRTFRKNVNPLTFIRAILIAGWKIEQLRYGLRPPLAFVKQVAAWQGQNEAQNAVGERY
jgi:hypothetical protein